MIKRLDSVISWFRTVIIAATSIASLRILDSVSIDSLFSTTAYLAAAIVVVVLLARGLEVLLRTLIDRSVKLRRIIMGSQFIEGYWIDRLIDVKTKRIISIGIIEIFYESGMLVSTGTGYSPTYEPLGTFQTFVSRYESLTLKYGYVSYLPFTEDVEVHGYGVYLFTKSSPCPQRFNGYMQDSHFKNKILLEGQKITGAYRLERIEDDEIRSKLVRDFAQRGSTPSEIKALPTSS